MVILAAIDRSDDAADVAGEARELAVRFDDTLHVLHVLSRADFVELETTSVEDTGEPVAMDRVRDVAADVAAEAAGDAGVDDFEAIGRVGDPSDVIVEYAAEVDARYVVIGGRKRSPAGKALFGSVTQSTILDSDRPVVVTMSDE